MSSSSAATRAFVPYPDAPVRHTAHGSLAGLSFGVKDLFDVAGYPTGAGNPHVLARSGIKTRHAPVVAELLAAGARFVGKTVTDELAFSAIGNNAHFGAPINGAAPERITGGSSSGSASAVSNGQCDFALGSDTGGSVRGPASHCGLYGMRPSQDRISLEGCFPLCATFDTCGFFARDATTFKAVSDALFLPDDTPLPEHPRVLIARDLFALLNDDVRAALQPGVDAIEAMWGTATPVEIGALCESGDAGEGALTDAKADAKAGLAALYQAYRVLQGWEAWQMQGARIESDGLCLGPDVAARFAYSKSITDTQAADAMAIRMAFTEAITELLGGDAIVILPTMPDIAPLKATAPESIEAYRNLATHLLGLAPMCGFAQVSIPFAGRDGAPLGLSLMSARGTDRSLVARIAELATHGESRDAYMPDSAITAAKQLLQGSAALAQTSTPVEVPMLSESALASLSWYAQHFSGAPIQAEDLLPVAELSRPVMTHVHGAAARILTWTDAQQSFVPTLLAESHRNESQRNISTEKNEPHQASKDLT